MRMTRDPIVAEVRRLRQIFSSRFGHNLHDMAEFIRAGEKEQQKAGRPVVSLEQKRRTG